MLLVRKEGRKVEGNDEAALRDAIYCCKEWTGGAWGCVCGWEGRCVREEARRVSSRSKVQVRREEKTIQLETRSWVQVQVRWVGAGPSKVQVCAGAGQQVVLAKQTPTEQLIGCPAGSGRRKSGARSLAQSAGTTQVAGDNRDQTLKRESATIIGQWVEELGGACRVPKYVQYTT